MQQLFATRGSVSTDIWNNVASTISREVFNGDTEADTIENLEFSCEKALGLPASLIKFTTNRSLSFRRSWRHIRSNRIGHRVIWLVNKGALQLSRSIGDSKVGECEAGMLDTNVPFHAKSECNSDGRFELYQLNVPAELFIAHMHDAHETTSTFSIETEKGVIVRRLLELLVLESGRIGERTAKSLIDSLLEAIADCISRDQSGLTKRLRLTDKRMADIKNYIMINLSDVDLCFEKVTANCNISSRHLCHVLKINNTSFSELLWTNRVNRARELLMSQTMRHYPIQEIAYLSGFKSATHFSRMFKSAYAVTPREFRMGSNSGNRIIEDSSC